MQRDQFAVLTEYPQVPVWALALFGGYVITWYLQVGERIAPLGAMRFEFVYAAFLTVVAICFIGQLQLSSPLSAYLVAYAVALLIHVPLSSDFTTSWNVLNNRVVKFAFMGFFIAAFVKSPRGLRFFLAAFLLACMKIGQEGFFGKMTGSMVWENQGILRLHGTTSLYGHPNSLAGNALGTLPFVIYLFPTSNRFVKVALLVLAIFATTIVLYSGSRTAYVAVIVLLAAVILKSRKRMRILTIVVAICTGAIPFVEEQYKGRFKSIFTQKEAEGQSAEARIQILKDAWQVFRDNPLGVGVAAFPKVRRERFGRTQDTHNLYFEVATNLGVQGLIVFMLLVHRMLKVLKELTQSFSAQAESLSAVSPCPEIDQQREDVKLLCATAKAVSVFILIRLALGLFGMDLYEVYWWFATGLTIALWNINKHARDITDNLMQGK